jgi:hypothetical protein
VSADDDPSRWSPWCCVRFPWTIHHGFINHRSTITNLRLLIDFHHYPFFAMDKLLLTIDNSYINNKLLILNRRLTIDAPLLAIVNHSILNHRLTIDTPIIS